MSYTIGKKSFVQKNVFLKIYLLSISGDYQKKFCFISYDENASFEILLFFLAFKTVYVMGWHSINLFFLIRKIPHLPHLCL